MKDEFFIGKEFEIKRIGLGTMRLTSGVGKWGMPEDKNHTIKLLKEAVEIGFNFFDTADMYGPYISERIIAEALYPYRKNIKIATKGGNIISGPNKVVANCSPEHLRKSVHGSLKRLKLERIDLYQLHTVDSEIDIEHSIEELVKLKEEDKIRCIGVSNINLQSLKRAMSVGEISSVQNRYNLNDRSSGEIISFLEKLGIAFISYYPLQKGALASTKELTSDKILTAAQEALLWQLKRFTNTIVIPGTTSLAHLKENFRTIQYLNK